MSDFEIYRGTDRTLTIGVVTLEAPHTPLDISESTLRFVVKYSLYDSDDAAVIVKETDDGITITDGPGGIATVAIDAIDWPATLERTALKWGLREMQGGRTEVLAQGDLTVLLDAARGTPT